VVLVFGMGAVYVLSLGLAVFAVDLLRTLHDS
jgi:hypothetical protein